MSQPSMVFEASKLRGEKTMAGFLVSPKRHYAPFNVVRKLTYVYERLHTARRKFTLMRNAIWARRTSEEIRSSSELQSEAIFILDH